MDSILLELSIIWNSFLAMELNQQIALGILLFLIMIYNLSASASFKMTRNGVERKIEKVAVWPGHITKIIWIVIALNFGLWVTIVVAILTMYVTIAHIQVISPLLLLAQPTITDRDKKKLENSF